MSTQYQHTVQVLSKKTYLWVLCSALMLTACGGGDSSSNSSNMLDSDNDGVVDTEDARPNDPAIAGEVIKTFTDADGDEFRVETYLFNAKKQPVKTSRTSPGSNRFVTGEKKVWEYDALGRVKRITKNDRQGIVRDIQNTTYSNNSATSYVRIDEIDNGNDGTVDNYLYYKIQDNRLVERAALPAPGDNSSFLVEVYKYDGDKLMSWSSRDAVRRGDAISFTAPAKTLEQYNYTGDQLTSKVSGNTEEYFYEYDKMGRLVGIERQDLSAQPTEQIKPGVDLFRYNNGQLSLVGKVDEAKNLPAGAPYCCRGFSASSEAEKLADWETTYNYVDGRLTRKTNLPNDFEISYSNQDSSARVDYFVNGSSDVSYKITFDSENRPASIAKLNDQDKETGKVSVSYKGSYEKRIVYFDNSNSLSPLNDIDPPIDFFSEYILPDGRLWLDIQEDMLTQFNLY